MPIELNDLETARFGIVAARVTDAQASPAEIEAAARDRGVQMLTARVDVGDLPRVHALEEAGYRLMDTLVYYARGLDGVADRAPSPAGEILRPATAADAPAVGQVARAAFAGYLGHYHADPRLGAAAADAAYVEWAETSVQTVGPRRPALVALQADRVVGFLTLRRNSDTEIEIVLNAVHPEAQRQGLYGRLVEHGMAAGRAAGCTRVIVSTQINNVAVQKVWARQGFCMSHGLYTFHKWIDAQA
ncbi:GNAT family N-acetyltransferase [Rhodovulum marinum]|uniref:Ribosomal protein S18 acetylase RimI-like enzyme n=1 Tax=Rhodovulum marinum TaxID=320662 RepID=A0A4R2PZ01_9RHOB|nr:GNAT family N-acetyltransferase [Rhodovulum marinum]TCP39525.1 ribosomal protein S18 acetylase RimI-like enzyme [Rhodovulum marinum]